MKFNKFFMLAMAGFAMTACSNDDDGMGNNLSGNGVVEVKIVAPQARVSGPATNGADGSAVKVEGTISVRLNADEGGETKEVTIENGQVQPVKFYGVKNPKSVEAWVNGGETNGKGTTAIDSDVMQVAPASIPAYGSSEKFNLTGTTETDGGIKYEMYSANVKMDIPVARLEISGITHKHTTEGATCKYQTLTINGIYLDKVSTTKDGEAIDYSWPEVKSEDGQTVITPSPILKDVIEEASFLDASKVWPAAQEQVAQAYAYNFYPNATQMPIVKIYFANATASNLDNPVSSPRYAVIKSYNNQANFTFEAGKIYRITKVELDDKNIIGDEEGNTLYGVDVTVTEAQWTVVNLEGQWAEQ